MSLSTSVPMMRRTMFTPEHAQSLLRLLAIIGRPLKCLHVPSIGLNSLDLRSILNYCPNLEELNVTGNNIIDIGPILDAYNRGQCRTVSLSLGSDTGDGVSLAQATALLALGRVKFPRGRHALHRTAPDCLAVVVIRLFRFNGSDASACGLAELAMSSLDYWRLDYQYHKPDASRIDSWFSSLPRTNLVSSPQHLPSQARIAFLSVVHRAPIDVVHDFDTITISRIFDFAGEIHCRPEFLHIAEHSYRTHRTEAPDETIVSFLAMAREENLVGHDINGLVDRLMRRHRLRVLNQENATPDGAHP